MTYFAIISVILFLQNLTRLVSNLGNSGGGIFKISKGGKFSLATSAHTKEGANQVFQFFFKCQQKILAKGGPWLNGPPKYASAREQR